MAGGNTPAKHLFFKASFIANLSILILFSSVIGSYGFWWTGEDRGHDSQY